MQLHAFLESLEKNAIHLGKIFVLCRSSNDAYMKNYQKVFNQFREVIPVFQEEKSAFKDFKDITLKTVFQEESSSSSYICFAVDDIIIQKKIDFLEIENLLGESSAYGFFLRLGSNITYCYMENFLSGVPEDLRVFQSNSYIFSFSKAKGDWCYPNNLDMTVYRKKDIIGPFFSLDYKNPNDLENKWSRVLPPCAYGLCYKESKIVNIPLNLVNLSSNRNMNTLDSEKLNKLYTEGLKLDIQPLEKFPTKAPHVEVNPVFKKNEHQ